MKAQNRSSLRVAIVGGGAAGFFAAFSVKEHHRDAKVVIFEKSNKILARLKFLEVADVTSRTPASVQVNFLNFIPGVKKK